MRAVVNAMRGLMPVTGLLSAALVLAGCSSSGGTHARALDSPIAKIVPERILPGPKNLMAMSEPRANGIMWALAGKPGSGLFEIDSANGHLIKSVGVSNAARSVTESAGVIGLALGTGRSGALELLNGRTAKVMHTVALPAPALQVVAGGDAFYVLTAWPSSASVTVVNFRNGKINRSIPVPSDTVSIASDIHQDSIYVLQKNGLVDEIGISRGQIIEQFKVGSDGESVALSPDASTLYVLKGTTAVANIAVVDVGTESVSHVLPAPGHCLGLLLSASGNRLYDVVGTSGYGNIQVFKV